MQFCNLYAYTTLLNTRLHMQHACVGLTFILHLWAVKLSAVTSKCRSERRKIMAQFDN